MSDQKEKGKTGVPKAAEAENKNTTTPPTAPVTSKKNEPTAEPSNVETMPPSDSIGGATTMPASDGNTSNTGAVSGVMSEGGVVSSEKERLQDEYIKSTLKSHHWYHGVMFNKLTEKLLKWDMSYLVRLTIGHNMNQTLVVSTRVEGKLYHYLFDCSNEGWVCNKLFEKFPRIPARRYQHIYQILDAWSLVVHSIVPVPRDLLVVEHDSIILEKVLGSGAFGEVLKGKYMGPNVTEPQEVAVKRTNGAEKRDQMQEFCHEALIMSMLDHPCVVSFYGMSSFHLPLMLVMEFLPSGDLKKYLKTTSNVPNRMILSFAYDVSRGMRHLATKKVVHRDLAARNCLLTHDFHVKIADFGLSIQGGETVVKKLTKAPIKWLAPETLLKGVFNERTDVWSYGVLLTELLMRCEKEPLAGIDNRTAQKLIKDTDFPHMRAAAACEPHALVNVAYRCLSRQTAVRPVFNSIKRILAGLYQEQLLSEQAGVMTAKAIEETQQLLRTQTQPRKNRSHKGLDVKRSLTTLQRKKSKAANRTTERRGGKGVGGKTSVKRKESRARLPHGMTRTQPPSPNSSGTGGNPTTF